MEIQRRLTANLTLAFSGANLAKVAEDAILRLGLSMGNARAQTYDGAANMQGKSRGCGTIIKQKYPLVLRFHCRAHIANLIVQAAAESCSFFSSVISIVHELSKLFQSSIKVLI